MNGIDFDPSKKKLNLSLLNTYNNDQTSSIDLWDECLGTKIGYAEFRSGAAINEDFSLQIHSTNSVNTHCRWAFYVERKGRS